MGLFDDKDDNGGIIGDVLNMEPRVIINHGDQSYNIAQHAEDTLGPVTFTPRELADLDQKMNLGWWAQQRQQSGVEQNQGTLPLRQSIGERVSDPTFNNVAEGEMVAEQVRRGQLRADWARNEVGTGFFNKWSDISAEGIHPKCNEFVYEAHLSGDPEGSGFPTVLREKSSDYKPDRYKPTVDNLADPTFSPNTLEYLPNVSTARPGDIVVWYGNGNHHSAIATGNGKVVYATTDGVKENSIEEASKHFPGVTPIIRRYK